MRRSVHRRERDVTMRKEGAGEVGSCEVGGCQVEKEEGALCE